MNDFLSLLGHLPKDRAYCLTAFAGQTVLGVGGFLRAADGSIWASVVMVEEARRYRVAIHRAGFKAMQFAQEQGYRMVYAQADGALAGAERWLEALGFVHSHDDVFVWRAKPLNS